MTTSHAYAALPPAARTLHQLLSLLPGESFTAEAAAALADLPNARTQQLLDDLTGQGLLTHTAGRYRQHAQARAHALGAGHDPHAPDTDAALLRLLDWYLHTARAAAQALDPHHWHTELPPPRTPPQVFATHRARAWFAEELNALHLAVRLAAGTGHLRLCWQLHEALEPYLRLRRAYTLWNETLSWARGTARTAADPVGLAVTATSQATLSRYLRHLEGAAQQYAHALELWEATTHLPGHTNTLIEYGHLEMHADRCGRARLKFTTALASSRALPQDTRMNLVLRARAGLGRAALGQGQPSDALEHFHGVIENPDACPDLRLQALTGLASAHLLRADPIATAHALQRADLLIPMVADPVASAELNLVRAHLHAHDPARRRTHLVRAHSVLRSVGDPRANAIQAQLDALGV
ncbi:hypothetical protein AB0M72_06935 [Nocardiopsis dassonvillei]